MSDLRLPYDPELFTPVPNGLLIRLVDRARRQLTSELRFVESDVDDVEVLERWLGSRPGTVSLPFPSAEPGDLLVKVARAEFWTFTVGGWRELAPVEIMYAGGPRAGDPTFAGRRIVERRVDPDRPDFRLADRGKGGISGAGFRSETSTLPVPEPFHPQMQEALDTLLELQQAIDTVLEAAADTDLGPGARALRSFADGTNNARLIVLDIATRHSRAQGVG